MTAETQRRNVRKAVAPLAPLVLDGNQLIITHGNGPQVGLLALQSAAGPADGNYPLDILDAESEGMIGYLIEQELQNTLSDRYLTATLLTQILVDRRDPAFRRPTKPVGPVYDDADAKRLAPSARPGRPGSGNHVSQRSPTGNGHARDRYSTPVEVTEIGY
jgi:carbamate kinase